MNYNRYYSGRNPPAEHLADVLSFPKTNGKSSSRIPSPLEQSRNIEAARDLVHLFGKLGLDLLERLIDGCHD